MRQKITKAYVRHYRDNGQVTAYVEWADGGRTEGATMRLDDPRRGVRITFGTHMHALFAAAKRQGIQMHREVW